MGYDDAKLHAGRAYTGMRVGGRHDWDYPDGRWQERKLAPDQWAVAFRSQKRRRHRAPTGSGAPAGTMFHWLLVAHQRVRKVDANTYETFLEGAKWKLGHRRPAWRRWSSEYRGQATARQRMIDALEQTHSACAPTRPRASPASRACSTPPCTASATRASTTTTPRLPSSRSTTTASPSADADAARGGARRLARCSAGPRSHDDTKTRRRGESSPALGLRAPAERRLRAKSLRTIQAT